MIGQNIKSNYLLKDDGTFIIKNYNNTHPFSNFLPGIAGEMGIPLWVFYVNRAQGVVSFGIKDKDHAIAEFFPANKAYSFVPYLGFRTFIKVNSERYYEPFKVVCGGARKEEMSIKSASFKIKEINPEAGLSCSVRYFTLPNTPLGGLVRVVTLKNVSRRDVDLEVIDGLSRVIPFGSINPFLKDISRTLEAWMHSAVKDNIAVFRLIVDPRDVSHTRYIEGANFNYSFYHDNGKKVFPYLVVDPASLFAQDTSYSCPVNFLNKKFKIPLYQMDCGKTPCSFSYFKWSLRPGQERDFYSVFGSAFKPDLIKRITKCFDAEYLKKKESENEAIVEGLKNNAFCVSESKRFNNYLKTTYLDNVLRGGYPYRGGDQNFSSRSEDNKNAYYIFSRKHGDLERDYNFFQLLPSYFSEGEGNYRDVNQNRRMDLFFSPGLGYNNIIYFLNFIKIDGYNPLVVKGEKLYFEKDQSALFLKEFGIKDQRLNHLMVKGFYLGDFFKLAEEEKIELNGRGSDLALSLLNQAEREPQALHGEGYWIDHWRYNLDLIESFFYFYPDKVKELFLSKNFAFWDDEHCVKDRIHRYVFRGGVVCQGESIEIDKEKRAVLKDRERFKNFLRTEKGDIYKTNLICKLLSLVLNKSATFDPDGIGIEMEADKPGWCDSLNGLPALFGSSLCETFELKRLISILITSIKQLEREGIEKASVPKEIFIFFSETRSLLKDFLKSEGDNRDYIWWNEANSIKENFRQKTYLFIEGKENNIILHELQQFLRELLKKVNIGIKKAKDKDSKLYFTYFTYTVTEYLLEDKHIVPVKFERKPLPLSIEGVMHALRVEGREDICCNLKKSALFDKKLKMYRLNASFKNESLEIGRSRVFVPGWLENESIWLHMEYKYILELLKNGFYEEFFTDFYNCVVCFFDSPVYGRSILENSSFIVSSAYPDKSFWGKGFVARLSGATAELLNIWILLCLGRNPFFVGKNKEFCISFSPILKKELFTTKEEVINIGGRKTVFPKNTFSFKLFSKTLVCYHNPKRKDTFSKDCCVEKVVISTEQEKVSFSSGIIKPPHSLEVRNLGVDRIDVYLG